MYIQLSLKYQQVWKSFKETSASPCDAVMLDLVHALLHDHDLTEDPRQRALHLHLPEVIPIAQALERGGREEQPQVIATVEKAAFVVAAAGL